VVLLGTVVLVSPVGAFPVDDDWIYAQTVQQLLTDGRYRRSSWIDTAFLAQAWWGAAASWVFGFSHTTLRASTLVLAALTAFCFQALLGRAMRPPLALAVTLLLVFHPLFLHLAYTFMTDVPFLAVMLAALWCVTMAPDRPDRLRLGWLAAGSASIALACLVRQIGIVLVPAVLLAALPELRTARVSRIRLLAVLVVPFGTVATLLVYADPRDVTVEVRLLDQLRASDPVTLLHTSLQAAGAAALLLGLSALPIVPLVVRRRGLGTWTRRQYVVAAVLLVLLAGAVAARFHSAGTLSPLFGNTLSPAGLTVSGLHPRAVSLSGPELAILAVGGLLGALALMVVVTSLFRQPTPGQLPLSVRLLAASSFGTLILTLGYGPLAGPVNGLYDRYLLPVLPGLLALVGYAVRERRAALPLLVVGVLGFAGWSISWQQEYLQRQAATWRVAEALVAQGVTPAEIDAGYEWNGWHRGPAAIEQARQSALTSGDARSFVQLVVDRIYQPRRWYIGFGPLGPGCAGRPAAEASYGGGWPVYGLRRCPPGNGPPARAPQAAHEADGAVAAPPPD
jgi:hypothetical protein